MAPRALARTPEQVAAAKAAEQCERSKARRRGRYRLRDALAEFTSMPRVARCGRGLVHADQLPTVAVAGIAHDRRAHYRGLQLCGAVHLCPVCGPYLNNERTKELDTALARWIEGHGIGAVCLLTLTVRHAKTDPLATVLRTVRKAFTATVSGRRMVEDRKAFGIAHKVTGHDLTVGKNGWHPHLHVVLLLDAPLTDDHMSLLEARMYQRWAEAVAAMGYERPTAAHGCQLERARTREDLARYVCQVVTEDADASVAMELGRPDLKASRHEGQRTPWQLLADIAEARATGRGGTAQCVEDLALWHEYERASKGVPSLRYSKGLRAAVGLGAAATVADVLAPPPDAVVEYQFANREEWRAVRNTPGAPGELLAVIELAGAAAGARFVATVWREWTRCYQWGDPTGRQHGPWPQQTDEGEQLGPWPAAWVPYWSLDDAEPATVVPDVAAGSENQ